MQQWHSESASAEQIIETSRIVIETKTHKKAYISHYKNGLTRKILVSAERKNPNYFNLYVIICQDRKKLQKRFVMQNISPTCLEGRSEEQLMGQPCFIYGRLLAAQNNSDSSKPQRMCGTDSHVIGQGYKNPNKKDFSESSSTCNWMFFCRVNLIFMN